MKLADLELTVTQREEKFLPHVPMTLHWGHHSYFIASDDGKVERVQLHVSPDAHLGAVED